MKILSNAVILCLMLMALQGCTKQQNAPELSDSTIATMNNPNANNPMMNNSYMMRSPSPATMRAAGARMGR